MNIIEVVYECIVLAREEQEAAQAAQFGRLQMMGDASGLSGLPGQPSGHPIIPQHVFTQPQADDDEYDI
uniref:Gag-pol polyprotein n=1 Tax=Heterorhabditis bacteriophora TaxID=37862 RepID=A0A1I7XFP7_HETBA